MTDIKTSEERSRNMAAIKGKDTKPELFLRKKLFALGYRYSTNASRVIGHPDVWLKRYRTAIFVHGCFWHRHTGCKYAYVPKSKIEFWSQKFEDNIVRDNLVKEDLHQKSIKCLIIWECTIRKMQKSAECCEEILGSIQTFLESKNEYLEI